MPDTIVVLGLALLAGQLASQDPAAAGAAALASLALAWPRLRRAAVALAVAAFAAGQLRAGSALRYHDLQRARVQAEFGPPVRCAGIATVQSSPVRLGDRVALLARAESIDCESAAHVPRGTLLRLYAEREDLARGDRIDLIASLGVIEVFRNPETAGARIAAARHGAMLSGGVYDATLLQRDSWAPGSWIDRARAAARRRIQHTYARDAAPMARALVLGEADLSPEDNEAFRVSGLSHLLAVSGTHIVVAVLGLVRLLERILVRVERWAAAFDVGRLAAVTGIPLAWAYAEFAGGGGSVRRAALMTSSALAARALSRHPDGPRAFGISLLAGGLADPLAAFDLSFGLSAGATAGLLLLSAPLQQRLRSLPKPLHWLCSPLAATISATLFCAPWLAGLGPSISLVGLIANLVAVPIGELISLPACLAHLLLSPLPPLERGVALLGSGSLLAVRAIARLGAQASFLSVPLPKPTPWQLAALAATITALLVRRPRDRRLAFLCGAALLVGLEVAQVRISQPQGRLRITVLDVGQGDSILVDMPDGRAVLLDGGGIPSSPVDPGLRVVAPVLRERRRSRIDIAILTHPHPDHVTGLGSSLPLVSVGQLWDTGYGAVHGAPPVYSRLVDGLRNKGVPIRMPSSLCHRPQHFGGAVLRMLAPCPGIDPEASANDNSIVVRIEYGSTRALLVGDAEQHEEERLLRCCAGSLQADLLKVGHHGSRTSSSGPFLDAVRPAVAVITSGVRNRYGHPAPETLHSLQARGVRVLRSDLHGAVVWESDGRKIGVSTTAGD